MVIVIKFAVCKFKWSNSKSGSPIMEYGGAIKLEACRPLWCKWTCEDVPKSSSPSGVRGRNQLLFIEPTQSRKVVQLEGVKIVFI